MTAGEIVLGYNLPGSPKALKLPRDVYPAIFLGKITKWTTQDQGGDPGVSLPDLDITVVRRTSTRVAPRSCSRRISAIGDEWKKGPGAGTTVNWPKTDKFVASPKNDGVTATIEADARGHRLRRVRLREVLQDRDGAAPESRGPVRQSGR
jgi:phosphate transport system substrate-binding protein